MNWFCDNISNLETSDCIALLGIFCTGLFSYLLWQTTKIIGEKQNELQKQQNRLQKNQTKLQEYHFRLEQNKAYRNLYTCLTDVKQTCVEFFYYLEIEIIAIVDEKERLYAQSFYDRIEALNKEIKTCRVDMDLQLTEYPTLTHDLNILYLNMHHIQTCLRNIQIPLNFNDKNDYSKTEMLTRMIKLVNANIPNYYIDTNTDINKLSTNDYFHIIYETRKILIASSWQLETFVEKSDHEIIKHISDELSCLTDNVSIDSWCNQFVEIKEKIFTKNKVLDIVREKCVLR